MSNERQLASDIIDRFQRRIEPLVIPATLHTELEIEIMRMILDYSTKGKWKQ